MWLLTLVGVVLCVLLLFAAVSGQQRGSSTPPAPGVEWMFHTKVVGVSRRNRDHRSRQKIIREHCCPGQRVRLVPEPENRFDENAIGVWTDDGQQIGYLSANISRIAVEKHEVEDLVAEISDVTGGVRFKTRGVNLRIGKIKRAAVSPQQQQPIVEDEGPF